MTGRSLVLAMVITAVVCTIGGRCTAPDPAVAVLEHAVAAAKDVRAAAVETVTVYVPRAAEAKKKSDAADAPVEILDDTLVSVRLTPAAAPTIVIVPPQVTTDLITLRRTVNDQALAIGALERLVAADSVVIRRQDSLIAAIRPPKCGAKCGGTIATVTLLLIRLVAK